MPFFEGEIVEGQPIINVAITLPNAIESDWDENVFRALVDTGATITAISSEVARKLNLVSIGREEIQGVTGVETVPVHRIALHIPITELHPTKTQVFAHEYWKHISPISAMEILGSENFDVLLGMDILSHCHFTVFNGKFTLGF